MNFISKAVLLKASSAVCAYLFVVTITNYWGIAVYGKYQLALILINLVSILYLFGLDSALLHDGVKSKNVSFNISHILFVIINILTFTIILYPFLIKYGSIESIIACSFLMAIIKFYGTIYRYTGRYVLQYMTQSILLFALLSIIVFYTVDEFTNIMIVLILISITCFPRKLIKFNYKITFRAALRRITSMYKEYYHFVIMTFTSVGLFSSDILVLGLFVDSELVGEYSLYTRVGLLVIFIWASISGTATKELSADHIGKEKLGMVFYHFQKIGFFSGIFVIFLYFIFRDAIDLIFNADISTDFALYIVLLSYLMLTLQGPLGIWSIINNRQKEFGILNIICVSGNISLNFLLIPYFGLVGAAFATLIAMCVHSILGYICIFRRFMNANT